MKVSTMRRIDFWAGLPVCLALGAPVKYWEVFRVRLISSTDGEPPVRKDIGRIIRHVKSHGVVCKLNTNGMLLGSRLADLRPVGLLQISVDGPPDVQDGLRGQGTSRKAARAIELARGEGIKVQLIACLTRDNVARLDEVLDYGPELDEAPRPAHSSETRPLGHAPVSTGEQEPSLLRSLDCRLAC